MNKFQYQIIFLGVVLLLIIFFSLSKVDPVPYSDNSVFSKAYPYSEGLEGITPTPIKESDGEKEPFDKKEYFGNGAIENDEDRPSKKIIERPVKDTTTPAKKEEKNSNHAGKRKNLQD